MNLLELVARTPVPQPWEEGEKIPWNDPDFSRRMLKEHLSQKHDAASRRTVKIKKHIEWIDAFVLAGKPSRILDLGCGPGLYSARLSTLGHDLVGIDFSPASIEYARKNSPAACVFHHEDIRKAEFGSGYDLVMFIFGEFNVFSPADAGLILKKAYAALKEGGQLLLEVHRFDTVEQMGNMPSTWYSSPGGLFSEKPHLCLMETFWDEERLVATERYLIVDAASGEVTRHTASNQAYEEDEYEKIIRDAGFSEVTFHPSLIGKEDPTQDEFIVIVAKK
jgi:SAM-dependent methyltransferase